MAVMSKKETNKLITEIDRQLSKPIITIDTVNVSTIIELWEELSSDISQELSDVNNMYSIYDPMYYVVSSCAKDEIDYCEGSLQLLLEHIGLKLSYFQKSWNGQKFIRMKVCFDALLNLCEVN